MPENLSTEPSIIIGSGLTWDTPLYRFIGLSQFVSMVESSSTYLSRLWSWDDPWEAPLGRLPRISTSGKKEWPLYTAAQDLFGQCWTRLGESDAMWRIYSRDHEGLRIGSTANKFKLLSGLKRAVLAPVTYTDSIEEVFQATVQPTQGYPMFMREGLHKRRAFAHEQEVRLLVLNDESFLGFRAEKADSIPLGLDMLSFITSIVIDPRAPSWFAEAIMSYCQRAGFQIEPTVSKLYSSDVHGATGMSIRYVPVSRTEGTI
jgi:hypothetical protein